MFSGYWRQSRDTHSTLRLGGSKARCTAGKYLYGAAAKMILNNSVNFENSQATITSIDEMLALERVVPVDGLTLASDIVAKNGSILVRKGQPFRERYRRYLETHDNYHPNISFRIDEAMMGRFRNRAKEDIESLLDRPNSPHVAKLIANMSVNVQKFVDQVLADPRIAGSLFDIRLRTDSAQYGVYDHLLTVGLLTLGTACGLDDSYKDPEFGGNALAVGMFHDIALVSDYGSAIRSREALDNGNHADVGAGQLEEWGFSLDAVHAVRYHHTLRDGSGPGPGMPKGKTTGFLCDVLTVAEYFTTLSEMNPGDDGVEEAFFQIANMGQQGSLRKDMITCLGAALSSYKDILAEAQLIQEMEALCEHGVSYAYPKIRHMKPTQIICRGNRSDCKYYRKDRAPLRITASISEGVLRKGVLNLKPGIYGKCCIHRSEDDPTDTGK